MAELVERFFSEEANEHVRQVLTEALDTGASSGSRYFTFNVLNVRLDFDRRNAIVEDELDPKNSESLTLEDLRTRLER